MSFPFQLCDLYDGSASGWPLAYGVLALSIYISFRRLHNMDMITVSGCLVAPSPPPVVAFFAMEKNDVRRSVVINADKINNICNLKS